LDYKFKKLLVAQQWYSTPFNYMFVCFFSLFCASQNHFAIFIWAVNKTVKESFASDAV
jgi:hypothetical protein